MVLLSALGHELNLVLGVFGLIFLLSLFLKRINQPYIIAYILTGIILGPFGFKLVTEVKTAELIGEFGLVTLMFFIGMEISLKDFLKKWKIAVFGTGMQILFSTLLVFIIGYFFDWSLKRIVLLGFVTSISSSAVVMKLIEDAKIEKTRIGQNAVSILLTQDIAIVPMIIIMTLLGTGEIEYTQLGMQVAGGAVITALIIYLVKKEHFSLPFDKVLKDDHELQVFGGLLVCFALSLFTSFFELSAGLGAFVAGLFVHASDSSKWLHDTLHPFRVVLISVFFLSVGMLIDLNFLTENWQSILFLVLAVLLGNQVINAVALRLLGNSTKESIYGGSLLAQIGEFSFVLASIGYHSELITLFSYQLTIIVISITIFVSPIWSGVTARLLKINLRQLQEYPD